MFNDVNARRTLRLGAALLAAIVFGVGCLPASARIWKPTPAKLATDYAVINDFRPPGDLILLMWFAPPVVRQDAANSAQIRALMDKYIFLAVVHGHFEKTTGAVSFENIDTLEAKDAAGKLLTAVDRSSMPPTTVGTVAVIERLFQQAFGAMGRGMKMFVFDSGDVHACQKGELSVPFAGDTYTWETPIPGCP